MYHLSANIFNFQSAAKQEPITSKHSHNIKGGLPIENPNNRPFQSNSKRDNQQPFIVPKIRQSMPKYSLIYCGG
jgi:hypothetical protein